MAKPPKSTPLDLVEIRKRILTAVASDDLLMELLVLKGGNALELVHRIGERASLDLDFSMEGDVEDTTDLNVRLERAVRDRLDAAGFVVFDWRFGPRPTTLPIGRDGRWGGYRAEFKLLPKELHRQLNGDLEAMRRRASEAGPDHQRVFMIDISKFEFCRGNMIADVDHFTCRVYTPSMIAAEKLRAICQQMPEYPQRRNPAPRPRDYYDIHAIATHARVQLVDELDLVRNMFGAKDVACSLIRFIGRDRERSFHQQGWDAVVQAVRGEVKPFDFYFDFLAAEALKLHPLWEEEPPLG